MKSKDIILLIDYEKKNQESVASWQVRYLWDSEKHKVKNDQDAEELSAHLRGMEDFYLRCIYYLYEKGLSYYLINFLSPEYAFYEVEFKNLNRSNLLFSSYKKSKKITPHRKNMSARIVRIAFDELKIYNKKSIANRKIRKFYIDYFADFKKEIDQVIRDINPSQFAMDWDKIIRENIKDDALRDKNIYTLNS